MSSPISGFTAIPNPQMLAFMPIQSYLMMYFAGSGWQYGKRKISAMSNEEFNKLTPERLLEQHSDELKRVMPTLEKTLNDVTPLIKILVEQYGDFIKEALKALPQALQNIIGGGGEFSTTSAGTGLGPAQTASFLHFFKILSDATKTNVPVRTGLQEFENTEAKRIAIQKIETARITRLKLELEAKRRAEIRLQTRQVDVSSIPSRGASNISCQSLRINRSVIIKVLANAVNNHRRAPPISKPRKLAELVQARNRAAAFNKQHAVRLRQCGLGFA